MKNYTTKLNPKDIANMEDVSGGGEPAAYLKSAEVNGKQLKIKNKDDSYTTYDPDLSKVTGTTSGDNWATVTIDGVTKNIPQGGGSDVQFDEKTIIKGSDNKWKTAAGGWKEADVISYEGEGTAEKGSTDLTLTGEIQKALVAGSTTYVKIVHDDFTLVGQYQITESHDDLIIVLDDTLINHCLILSDGSVGKSVNLSNTAGGSLISGHYDVQIGGGDDIYHKIESKFLDLDPNTMGLTEDGKIKCTVEAPQYTGSDGIEISDNNIKVNFGGDLHYTDVENKWEDKNFMKFYDDVYGLDGGPVGDMFENDKHYRLKATMFGNETNAIFKATNLQVQIQGSAITSVGIYIGKIQDMDAYVINYTYGGDTQPALVIEGCTMEIPFTSEDMSTLTELEEHVGFINNKVLDIAGNMIIDADGKLAANVLPSFPDDNGDYLLKLTKTDEGVTLSWELKS